MSSKFQQNLDEHRALFARLEVLAEPVARAASLVAQVLTAGRKLMLCGNGGSAADSQHLAAEFTGRFINDRRPLAALALSTDTSALTCIANDYSFDEVFYRQVLGLGTAGDCLLAGFAIGLWRGWPIEQCGRYAVACGTAKVTHPETGMLASAEVEDLARAVSVTSLAA